MNFPKMFYGPDAQVRTVASAEEAQRLGEGWSETPSPEHHMTLNPSIVEVRTKDGRYIPASGPGVTLTDTVNTRMDIPPATPNTEATQIAHPRRVPKEG